jgi:hypothetical protein
MFGGFGDGGPLSDTWAFDGDHWKLLDNQGPKDRIPHGMYWDAKRKSVMMITVELNKTPGNISSKNEWWQWSGSGWKLLPTLFHQSRRCNLSLLLPEQIGGV